MESRLSSPLSAGPHRIGVATEYLDQIGKGDLLPLATSARIETDVLPSFEVEGAELKQVQIFGEQAGSSYQEESLLWLFEEAREVLPDSSSLTYEVQLRGKGRAAIRLTEGEYRLAFEPSKADGPNDQNRHARSQIQDLVEACALPISVEDHPRGFVLGGLDSASLQVQGGIGGVNPWRFWFAIGNKDRAFDCFRCMVNDFSDGVVVGVSWNLQTVRGHRRFDQVNEGAEVLAAAKALGLKAKRFELDCQLKFDSFEALDHVRGKFLRSKDIMSIELFSEELDGVNYINFLLEATADGYFFRAESRDPVKRKWVRERYGLDIPIGRAF